MHSFTNFIILKYIYVVILGEFKFRLIWAFLWPGSVFYSFFKLSDFFLFWPYLRNYLTHIEEISPQHRSYSVVQKRSTTAPWEINILPANIFFLIKKVDFKWIFRFFTFFSQTSKIFISGVVLDNFNRSFAFDHKFYRLEGHICGYIFAPFKFVIFLHFVTRGRFFS